MTRHSHRLAQPFLPILLAVAALAAGVPAPAIADDTSVDELWLTRVGTGEAPLPESGATRVSIMRVRSDGDYAGGTIPLRTSKVGTQWPISLPARDQSSGLLSRSLDGRFVTLAGIGIAPGATSPENTTEPRVVARIDGAGAVDTGTALKEFSQAGAFGAFTVDGSRYWVTGNGNFNSPARGFVSAPAGSQPTDPDYATKVTSVFSGSNGSARIAYGPPVVSGGNLYVTNRLQTGNALASAVRRVGTGLPTSGVAYPADTPSVVDYPGPDAFAIPGFVFLDRSPAVAGDDTLYVARRGVGIAKYSFDGTTWAERGVVPALPISLTGRVDADGDARLYAVLEGQGAGARNPLVAIEDTASFDAPVAATQRTILTSATHIGFRGVALAPTPATPTPSAEEDQLWVSKLTGAPLGTTTLPVSIQRITDTGASAGADIPMPTADGTNRALTLLGNVADAGRLTQSADRRYVTLAGFDAPPGASTAQSSNANVTRSIARVDEGGAVDTSTGIAAFRAGSGGPTSAVTDDGGRYWVGGTGTSTSDGFLTAGVVFAQHGSSAATRLLDGRLPTIADGQLVGQPANGASPTLARLGAGLPVAPPLASTPLLTFRDATGFNVAMVDYALLDRDPAVPGIDSAYGVATSGALVKYSFDGSAWTFRGALTPPTPFTRITGRPASGGVAKLFLVAGGALNNSVQTVTDIGAPNGSLIAGAPTTIATAGPNAVFRGIAFAAGYAPPPPDPLVPDVAKPPTVSIPAPEQSAALGDPTRRRLPIVLADPDTPVGELRVATASSNPAVVAASGVTIGETGATRMVAVEPLAAGTTEITITVTDPDGLQSQAVVRYAVSKAPDDPQGVRWHTQGSDASTAQAVDASTMLVADDEFNDIGLYDRLASGPPLKRFDLTANWTWTASEIDFEGSARSGDRIVWAGSHGRKAGGADDSNRKTLVGSRISGSGLDIELTYTGRYTRLRDDLVAWDAANGHGLGAGYLDLATSIASGGTGLPDTVTGLNMEGIEFAPDGQTLYLGFRGPLEPPTDRQLAMIVPVTNLDELLTGHPTPGVAATFGQPIFMDLGGRGIREIRRNAAGQYLILAGPATESGSFAIYTWDGRPDHAPLRTLTAMDNGLEGSWEGIVEVPDEVRSGAGVQLVRDNGDAALYPGDPTAAKAFPRNEWRKFHSDWLTLSIPTASTAALAVSREAARVGDEVTLSVRVRAAAGGEIPPGTVTFYDGGDALGTEAVDEAGEASLSTATLGAGAHALSATFDAQDPFQDAGSNVRTVVISHATTTTLELTAPDAAYHDAKAATVTVAAAGASAPPAGEVRVLDGAGVVASGALSGDSAILPLPADLTVGVHQLRAEYLGGGDFAPSQSEPVAQTVRRQPASVELTVDPLDADVGAATSASVAVTLAGTAQLPSGTVTVRDGSEVLATWTLADGEASGTLGTALAVGGHALRATYDGSATAAGASSDPVALIRRQPQGETPPLTVLVPTPVPTHLTTVLINPPSSARRGRPVRIEVETDAPLHGAELLLRRRGRTAAKVRAASVGVAGRRLKLALPRSLRKGVYELRFSARDDKGLLVSARERLAVR